MSALNAVKTCYDLEEAGKIKQEFNRRNVRQLPPPDLYNGDGCEHTVSISRRRVNATPTAELRL